MLGSMGEPTSRDRPGPRSYHGALFGAPSRLAWEYGMDRRTFVQRVTLGIHGLIGLGLAVPGLRFLLDPLFRSRAATGFVRVLPLSALPAGQPVRAVITADRWDAYTHYPPGPIGSVWLLREGPDETPTLRCLQTICPHLGCGIDYAADRNSFGCPCHASDFDLTGKQRFGPSPRDMDELACRVTQADAEGRRWVEVRYEEYLTGMAAKNPVA